MIYVKNENQFLNSSYFQGCTLLRILSRTVRSNLARSCSLTRP